MPIISRAAERESAIDTKREGEKKGEMGGGNADGRRVARLFSAPRLFAIPGDREARKTR